MSLLHHRKYAGNISTHMYIQKKIFDKDRTDDNYFKYNMVKKQRLRIGSHDYSSSLSGI
jgi:hypothetical protein